MKNLALCLLFCSGGSLLTAANDEGNKIVYLRQGKWNSTSYLKRKLEINLEIVEITDPAELPPGHFRDV